MGCFMIITDLSDYQGHAYKPFINFDFNEVLEHVLVDHHKNGAFQKFNKFGYRGEEFTNNVDLLVLGCSNTMGFCLPEEYMWSNMLRSEKIKSINSLACSGDSAMGQIIKFFKYVKVFGNPKNLFAVFPAYRLEFPLESKTWEVLDEEKKFTQINYNKASICIDSPNDNSHFQKYSMAPYDPNKLFTKQIARYFTHNFINILDIYCKEVGINFKYTIYDYDYRFYDPKRPVGESLKEYMSAQSENYFTYDYPLLIGFKVTEEELSLDCHKDKNIDIYFHRAGDYIENKNPGHWGLHHNIHIAEALKDKVV